MIFNPGVSASFSLVLLGFWAFKRWHSERHLGFLLIIALLWGVLPGFKVYPALLVLTALAVTGLARWVFQKDLSVLAVFGAVLPVFLLVFCPSIITRLR